MPRQTRLTRQLNLAHPIIQAPMAGGGDTPALVSAVCESGALGFVGAAYLSPELIEQLVQTVRAKTERPFGINLFAPLPALTATPDSTKALLRVAKYHEELSLPGPTAPSFETRVAGSSTFEEQLQAVLQSEASVLSFTFGFPSPEAVTAIKARGLYLIGTATTVAEAVLLEEWGANAIVAQGSEAGGHRGTFAGDFEMSMVSTMALVPQMVDAVTVPVIASGGIMDGRGIAAALALGASAVQMGTAFLTCHEAGASEGYKETIMAAHEDQTRLTRAFSGRPARGIVNRFMTEVEGEKLAEEDNEAILPFPLQNALTRPLRTAASKQGHPEFLSLWAGQGLRMARRQSAADLIERLVRETDETIEDLSGMPTMDD